MLTIFEKKFEIFKNILVSAIIWYTHTPLKKIPLKHVNIVISKLLYFRFVSPDVHDALEKIRVGPKAVPNWQIYKAYLQCLSALFVWWASSKLKIEMFNLNNREIQEVLCAKFKKGLYTFDDNYH